MAELITRPLRIDPNLVSYWRFEGNSNDSVGTNNGTDTSMTYPIGKYGQGAFFDGTNVSVINTGAGASLAASVFTYAAWVNPTDFTATRTIKGSDGNGDPQFRIETNGNLGLIKQNLLAITVTGGVISAGVWSHVAVSYDASGNYQFYINGSKAVNGTNLQTFTFNNMLIGKQTTNVEPFFGTMDELVIFNRVLTPTEVTQLYLERGVSGSLLRPHPFSPGLAR